MKKLPSWECISGIFFYQSDPHVYIFIRCYKSWWLSNVEVLIQRR